MPPKGYKKNVHMLQANDSMVIAPAPEAPKNYLLEDDIRDAIQPFVDRGVRLSLDDDTWYLTLNKKVYDVKGKVCGSGDVKICGNRQMPIKDLLYSARELMIEITPGHC